MACETQGKNFVYMASYAYHIYIKRSRKGHKIQPRKHSLFQQKMYIKSNTWSSKSADTAKTSSDFEKKSIILMPYKIQEKPPNFHEISMSYKKL